MNLTTNEIKLLCCINRELKTTTQLIRESGLQTKSAYIGLKSLISKQLIEKQAFPNQKGKPIAYKLLDKGGLARDIATQLFEL